MYYKGRVPPFLQIEMFTFDLPVPQGRQNRKPCRMDFSGKLLYQTHNGSVTGGVRCQSKTCWLFQTAWQEETHEAFLK